MSSWWSSAHNGHELASEIASLRQHKEYLEGRNFSLEQQVQELQDQLNEYQQQEQQRNSSNKKRKLTATSGSKTENICELCGSDLTSASLEKKKPAQQQNNQGPIYGSRENPIETSLGLIDGRSNAQAAFDQKCQLLCDYKKEYGHLDIPVKPPEKYAILNKFVTKQRAYYKKFQAGDKTFITAERIERLTEIGLVWAPQQTDEEKRGIWKTMYKRLKEAFASHGHCCVGAMETHKEDKEFRKWASEQRRLYKSFRLRQKEQQAGAEENEADKDADGNGDQSASSATLNKDNSDKKKKYRIPGFFTAELQSLLQQLQCDWLHSGEDDLSHMTPKPNTIGWYCDLERFRDYVAKGGNVYRVKSPISALNSWARQQRKVYNAIQSGEMKSIPILERNIELVKQSGLIFDQELLKQEAERIAKKEAEEVAEAVAKQSPAGQLEEAKKQAEEAKDRVKVAKEKAREINKEIKEAEYLARQAQQKVMAKSAKMAPTYLVATSRRAAGPEVTGPYTITTRGKTASNSVATRRADGPNSMAGKSTAAPKVIEAAKKVA